MALESNSDRLMSDINVTPFVDVMLVLLIIFMVTAPMMTEGVDVSLPQASSKPLSADKGEQLVVTIRKDNQVYVNDHAVSLDRLREKLIKTLENHPTREVYFRADKDIAWGMGVRVMAEIKASGIEKLGIVTAPADKKETGAADKTDKSDKKENDEEAKN